MVWKEKVPYTFSYLLPVVTGLSTKLQDKVVVGWSGAAVTARLSNKSVPFTSVILHPRHP